MKIAVVIANQAVIDPVIDVYRLGEIGSTWGSWHQWHQCHPNHLICYDDTTARRLIANQFSTLCNLYVPSHVFDELNQPAGTRPYAGRFTDDVVDPEELIAIHLAAASAEVVVLLGFTWDQMAESRLAAVHAIITDSKSQWVVIADAKPQAFSEYTNVHHDTLENMLDL